MENLLCLNKTEKFVRTLTHHDELVNISKNQNSPTKKNKNNRYTKIKLVLSFTKDIIKNIFL